MNKLPLEIRVRILSMLVEGSPLRSISRICGVSINTVTKLLVDAGMACADHHDKMVRNVKAKRIQGDEIWSFCYAKERNVKAAKAAPDGAGSVWTWTAFDPDSKLMVTWWVGDRSGITGLNFLDDLQSRLANQILLTTDGNGAYLEALHFAFGDNVDFDELIKLYKKTKGGTGRYSAAERIGTKSKSKVILITPDADQISTPDAECQNMMMRISMGRFNRANNAFSKKFENHCHSLALYFLFYNWMRNHEVHGKTPAMAAGLTDKALTMAGLIEMIDARELRVIREKRH